MIAQAFAWVVIDSWTFFLVH